MGRGFIFDQNKCVNCGACRISCIIENRWTISPRSVYTYNPEAISSQPLVNLSLACNHCEEPVCLKGCPSGAYVREPSTGAIVIDDNKCIGCKYCQWNCPYDAPKFDEKKRIIEKCNLCYSGLIEGRLPACSNGCPTGALSFGLLSGKTVEIGPVWFPDKNLYPSIEFTAKQNIVPLRIIPEKTLNHEILHQENEKTVMGEWSLIGFTFLATLSVSTVISSLINGEFPANASIFILTIFMAGIISLFHTGRVLRSWRSLANIKTSPLSREIAAFILYSAFTLGALFFQLPFLLITASVTGLVLLITIDSVYIFADRRRSVVFHSGQTFLSSLLIISFFTGNVIPFIFIALIKLVSSIVNLSARSYTRNRFGIKFLRLALLIVTGISLVTGGNYPDPLIVTLFLTGEFIDRINFYDDFKPLNIKTLIYNHLITDKDEKKRG
jgi:Fe-S-cluster-containing dehydrogenase component